jgi:Mrp family chromosome partitioning ATPase
MTERGPVPIWLSALRRRWAWPVIGLILGLLAAVGYQRLSKPDYQASTQVVVRAIVADPFGVNAADPSKTLSMPTEQEIAGSTSIAADAAKLLHTSDSPKSLLKHLSVSTPASTEILSFRYSASTASAAAHGANAFAAAYLADRASRVAVTVRHMATALNKQSHALTVRRDQLTTAIANEPTGAGHDADVAERSQLNQELATLATQQTELSGLDQTPGYVTASATAPGHRSGPSMTLLGAAGGLIGLLVGLVLGQLRDSTDDRIRGADEVSDALGGVRVLGDRPLRVRADARRGELAGETGRAIGLQLLAGWAKRRCLLVLSGRPNEGRTMVAAALATAVAQMGRRVVVASADFARPALHRMFGLPAAPGLAEELRGARPAVATLPDQPGLLVVASGDAGEDRAVLARHGDEFAASIARWRTEADLVLIDTPPLLSTADALAAAPAADAGLLVVSLGRTTRTELRQSRATLESLGLPLVGAVLVRRRRFFGGRRRPPALTASQPVYAHPTITEQDTAVQSTAVGREGQVPADRRPLRQPAGTSIRGAGRDTT